MGKNFENAQNKKDLGMTSDHLPTDSLTFLHVSDMQFGHNHRFGRLGVGDDSDENFDTLFSRLRIDLDLLKQKGLVPQFVVVSGDLAEKGLRQEFDDALKFVSMVSDYCHIKRNHVIINPGNHDINRKHCEGYFATCEGDNKSPLQPYWPKWKHYHSLFEEYYASEADVRFTESTPWTLYEINDLRIVVAALNSTMQESHREDDHYGLVGERQMRWFAERLEAYKTRGWFRLAVVHHNMVRGPVEDEENLRDVETLKRILNPYVNLFVHGHTHESGLAWADNNIPILSTGSAALKPEALPTSETGNQYQIVRLHRNKMERWTRRYDSKEKRWIGDTRCSTDGADWYYAKDVAFDAVEGTFSSRDKSEKKEEPVVAIQEVPPSLVRTDSPVDAVTARQQLRELPRLRLIPENQHRAARRSEQELLASIFETEQALWLVADWQVGKDGFLASALERFGGPEMLTNVYRLQCGAIKTCDELLREAETALGLSFQEFFAAVATIPKAVLVFDDLPLVIAGGAERDNFDRRVRPIFDFCPELKLIFVSRQKPKETNPREIVELKALEVPEMRQYLLFHTRAKAGLDDPETLESIYEWSGGLPMHLDRLLERFPFVPLPIILGEYNDVSSENASEPLPESLKVAVATLQNSGQKDLRSSFKLLSILTVLRDGETFQSIQRFHGNKPYHQEHIDELVNLALLEDVPIAQTAADLTFTKQNKSSAYQNVPRLLKVPRHVRDYVNTLLSDDERDKIVRTSTELFFGPKWPEGKIRLRNTLANAYGQSAIAGPGNEHVVAKHLLSTALEKRNKQQISRYTMLAVTYCHKLDATDRFRDAVISARAISDLLRDTSMSKEFVETAHVLGKALRMTGNDDESVLILREALERGESILTDDYKSSVYLSLALALQDLKQKEDALEAARKVLAIAHKESSDAFQANAIIAELTLTGSKKKSRLMQLETSARNLKRAIAANNISLNIAVESEDPDEALKWCNKVINTAQDSYSKARAIVEKVSVLKAHLREHELGQKERQLLDAAYSYSYSQRIGNLLDRCHSVLWDIFTHSKLWSAALRLYRFSSFIWRLRGNEDRDLVYLRQLDSLDVRHLEAQEGQTLQVEILYLERRRKDQPLVADQYLNLTQ